MMWRDGVVIEHRRLWGQESQRCAELSVRITAHPDADSLCPCPTGEIIRALAYESITGLPDNGERVRVEVSALARGLGTGGHAMVCARLDVLPPDRPSAGHLVKARYMPEQVMVTGVDEQGSEHHPLLSQPIGTLTAEGMPVVVADLHSSLPAILAGVTSPSPGRRDAAPTLRVAYIMTDGGALPLAYSQTVAALSRAGWLAGTITCGQAWGGDVEAVSIHNAILAARHVLAADIAILTQGPGNLGTDTPWGFSGVICGEAVNAIALLEGRPVVCLRVSQADPRPRHRGISHHTLTAIGQVAVRAADVVVPALEGELGAVILQQAQDLCAPRPAGDTHRCAVVSTGGLHEAVEAMEKATGMSCSTMGRGLAEDTAAFLTAAAAGRYAAQMAVPVCAPDQSSTGACTTLSA